MSGFVEQLMLAEKAAENIYFAKVNRELIESLHKQMQAGRELLSTAQSSTQARMDESVHLAKETGVG